MNAASRLTLHLALAAAAGYAGAAYHLRTQALAAQPRPAGMIVQTRSDTTKAGPPVASRTTGAGYREAAVRAGASVVTVYCGGAGSSVVAVASGVIVHGDGLVVTTSVVGGQSERVIVTLPDGTQQRARLLGADPGVGLALLKVEGAGLEPIEMSGPGTAAVGDAVLALGDALGLGPTVTQGIISAIRPAQMDGKGETLSFIQTDASIHPGNFGGALVDVEGRLVGITVGTVGPTDAEGLAFAVPAQRVARFITQLQRAAHAEPAHPRTAPERGRFTEVSFPPASITGRN